METVGGMKYWGFRSVDHRKPLKNQRFINISAAAVCPRLFQLWHHNFRYKMVETIGDSTIADAILGRLAHTANRIAFKDALLRKTILLITIYTVTENPK